MEKKIYEAKKIELQFPGIGAPAVVTLLDGTVLQTSSVLHSVESPERECTYIETANSIYRVA